MMLSAILFLLRFLFLVLFYLFIFKLTLTILDDLRNFSKDKSEVESVTIDRKITSKSGNGAALIVLASTDNEIPDDSTLSLYDKTVLGRAPDCHIRIDDMFVSYQHAAVTYHNDQYWVEDLNSLNGTYVNEVKLQQPTVLADGDRLRVGGVSFEFVRWAYAVEPNNRSGAGKA